MARPGGSRPMRRTRSFTGSLVKDDVVCEPLCSLPCTFALQSAVLQATTPPVACVEVFTQAGNAKGECTTRVQAAHAALSAAEADGTALSPAASELLFSFERSQSGHQLKSGGAEEDATLARKGSSGDLQHVVALGRPGTEFEQQVCLWPAVALAVEHVYRSFPRRVINTLRAW